MKELPRDLTKQRRLTQGVSLFFLLAIITILHFIALRAVDFAWNRDLFAQASDAKLVNALLLGLRFDLSALAYLMVLPLLWALLPLPAKARSYQFWLASITLIVVALPLFSMSWVDIELIRFTKARMTPATLFLFSEGQWKADDFMSYLPLVAVAVGSVALWLLMVMRITRHATNALEHEDETSFSTASKIYQIVLGFLMIGVLAIGIRGGISNSKPIKPVDTFPELHLGNWALNTPFVFIKGFNSARLATPKYFKDRAAMMALLNGSVDSVSEVAPYRVEKPQNVVILIMESLSLGYMGEVNHVKGYTPFLDELADRSLFFSNAFANASRSIDGIPAVLAALPAMGVEPFLTSPYGTASFEGLPQALSQHHYQTAFFHGAKRGSMFFDQFAKRAGFKYHFAREDYPNPDDADTSWGIPDEPFFQFVANKADTFYEEGSPFMVAAFSLSAHFPFNVPKHYQESLPEGPIKMLQSQAYADLALRRFFETVEKKSWYNDTLFVITADHGSMPYLEEYLRDPLGEWRIPIIFFHPRVVLPRMATEDPIQQIDIMPSILDFLNIETQKAVPLARSVFRSGNRAAVIRAGEGFYTVAGQKVLYEKETGEGRVLLERGKATPLDDTIPEDLLLRSHAAQQYYSEAMRRRQWYDEKM